MRRSVVLMAEFALVLAVLLHGTAQASAPPAPSNASGWRVRSMTPVAVRGGVVAVEIEPSDARSPLAQPSKWPATLAARSDDGATRDAVLAVVTPAPRRAISSWTAPADDLVVLSPSAFAEAIASGRFAGEAVVVAMLRFDESFAGEFEMAGARVAPRWFDADPEMPIVAARTGDAARDAEAPAAATSPERDSIVDANTLRIAGSADDRPDARSPGEYWRWVLLAQELEQRCEPPPWSGAGALYAQHRAELWCAALARIRRVSPSVAKELRELLTARARDPIRPAGADSVAIWISQATELNALLAILLDGQRSHEATMRAAMGWMQSRPPLTTWIESDSGDAVTLAAANPLPEEAVLRCAWLEAPKEAPVALLVPAHAVARIRIERPQASAARQPGQGRVELIERWRSGLTLRLESGAWRGRTVVGPGIFSVRPPGLGFSTFVPSLTLVAAQSQRLEPTPTPWRTTASIRRLAARWELFIECLRPAQTPEDVVEITIADPLEEPVRFTIDDGGTVTMIDGAQPADLAVHARRHADRWRVRIELPDAWIPRPQLGDPERVFQVAMERRPGPLQGRQTAVLAVPSWRPPPSIRADLSSWIEMPRPSAK